MAAAAITAVIVNWNRPADTLECIASLQRQQGCQVNILVVDNGSTDGSVELIRQGAPEVTIIVSQTNLGFGSGSNLGLRQAMAAGADYVLLVNNDAILAPDGLQRLLLYATPGVGLLAPLIYYAGQPDTIWSAGGRTSLLTLEKHGDLRNQRDPGGWSACLERDFVTGCCVLVPRSTLEQVGLFDERFWMYYEDSDYCRRVRQAGLRILVIPSARLWHKVAVSSGGSDTPNERYWMARSSVIFFRKHAGRWHWPMIAPYRLGSAIKTSLRLLIKGRPAALSAYWRGLRDGLALTV